MQAVILAGGKGTRLQTLYADRPKPLVPVKGKPFLQWQVEWLAEKGIRDVHLAAGHMGKQIEAWAASDPVPGVTITASVEPERLGTGGGVKYAESFIRSDPFLLLNGDSLAPNLDFQPLEKLRKKFPIIGKNDEKSSNDWKNREKSFQSLEKGCITIAVIKIEQTGRYGTVEFNEDGQITAFLEKTDRKSGWINAGIYLIDQDVLNTIPAGKNLSLETDIFPQLTAAGVLFASKAEAPLLDMGTPEGLATMEAWLESRK